MFGRGAPGSQSFPCTSTRPSAEHAMFTHSVSSSGSADVLLFDGASPEKGDGAAAEIGDRASAEKGDGASASSLPFPFNSSKYSKYSKTMSSDLLKVLYSSGGPGSGSRQRWPGGLVLEMQNLLSANIRFWKFRFCMTMISCSENLLRKQTSVGLRQQDNLWSMKVEP
jgi:hypothetical protein